MTTVLTMLTASPLRLRPIRKAYRVDGRAAHLPDPFLDPPEPEVWWFGEPEAEGWYVGALCGQVLRRAHEAAWDDEMCRTCMAKGIKLLEAYEAAQGRTA